MLAGLQILSSGFLGSFQIQNFGGKYWRPQHIGGGTDRVKPSVALGNYQIASFPQVSQRQHIGPSKRSKMLQDKGENDQW